MRVAKWGNSLAIRIPAVVAEAMELKEGDDIDIQIAGHRQFDAERELDRKAAIRKLSELLRGRLPPDFKFNRADLYED